MDSIIPRKIQKLEYDLSHDKNIWNETQANEQELQNIGKGSVKVLLNGHSIFTANKQKLTEKSSYFRTMLSPHFIDHKYDFAEVNFNTSVSTFKQVIEFLNTGSTRMDFFNLFEIYKLSLYLQIEELLKLCYDYFVENLKPKYLEAYGDFLENSQLHDSLLGDTFKSFKESNRPSIPGFYILNTHKNKCYINMLSEDLKKVYEIPNAVVEHESRVETVQLEQLGNKLLFCVTSKNPQSVSSLHQYDVITSKIKDITSIKNGQTVICSNKSNFFTASVVEDGLNKSLISLTVYGVKNRKDVMSSHITKNFTPFFYKTKNSTSEVLKPNLLFCHSANGQVHVFYYAGEPACDVLYLNRVYLMTICQKSMSVVKADKLTNMIAQPKNSTVAVDVKQRRFKKMFADNQQGKVFIVLNELQDTMLVFDCCPYFKHPFYFSTKQMPYTFDCNVPIAIKEGILYSIGTQGHSEKELKKESIQGVGGYVSTKSSRKVWVETKCYQCENDCFTDHYKKIKSDEVKVENRSDFSVMAACYVENNFKI